MHYIILTGATRVAHFLPGDNMGNKAIHLLVYMDLVYRDTAEVLEKREADQLTLLLNRLRRREGHPPCMLTRVAEMTSKRRHIISLADAERGAGVQGFVYPLWIKLQDFNDEVPEAELTDRPSAYWTMQKFQPAGLLL